MPSNLQKKKPKRLCPALVNNVNCSDRDCRYSHNMKTIRWWQQHAGSKPCKHGRECSYLAAGTCLWFHTNVDWERVELQRADRVAMLTCDLGDLELLTVESQAVDGNFVSITDARDLASFNKVSDGEIAVPGCPPRFAPLTGPLVMDIDARNKAVSFDHPRYTHPFEPLLRSVEVMQPTIDILDASDVISNASNLRKLFDLLRNRTWRAERFDIEMRGETMLLSRWNEDPHLSHSLGFGAGFERATCQHAPDDDPVIQGSASHHRVVTYRFGGLQCVVQSEVDAYYCDCDHSEESPSRLAPAGSRPEEEKPHSDLAASFRERNIPSSPQTRLLHTHALTALVLSDPDDGPPPTAAASPVKTTTPSPTLRIHHTGCCIPSGCLVEVKTRNAGSIAFTTPEAQLYFSRRTHLYMAEHVKGLFTPGPNLAVRDMTADLEVWEKREQATLRKVTALLRLVRERVRALKERSVERVGLVCEGNGTGQDGDVKVRLCERMGGEGGRLLP